MDGKMEFGKTNEIVQENQLHYPRSVTEQWNLQQFMANVEGRGGQKYLSILLLCLENEHTADRACRLQRFFGAASVPCCHRMMCS